MESELWQERNDIFTPSLENTLSICQYEYIVEERKESSTWSVDWTDYRPSTSSKALQEVDTLRAWQVIQSTVNRQIKQLLVITEYSQMKPPNIINLYNVIEQNKK